VLLVVHCGDVETVRVPVLDFFGGGPDWRENTGYLLGVQRDGTAWCNLPMPMPDGGSIELVSERRLDGLGLQLRAQAEPHAFGAGVGVPAPLLLHASWHLEKGMPTRPFRDHLVLAASGGAGRFVGTALIVKNPHRAWWGEGDEKFYVDGEQFPSTFGTGTE